MCLKSLVRLFVENYLLISDMSMNGTDLPLHMFLKCSNNVYG